MDSITRNIVLGLERVMRLTKEVIQEEENREILQTNLIPMEYLLHHITTVFQDQLSEAARESLKVWLQLLHNCLTHAKSILRRSNSRQRCLDCLNNNAGRASTQIKNWRVHFNYLFQSFQSDFPVFVRGPEAVIAPVIAPIIPLVKAVIEEEEEKYHILQTELRPVYNLLLDVSAVFQDQHKAAPEALKIWLQLLHGSLLEANSILHRCDPSQQQPRHDCLTDNPGTLPKQVNEWKVLFNYFFQGLHEEFSMFVTSTSYQIINRVPIPRMRAQGSLKQLSKYEAWMLFRRIAFEDNPVPMDIKECANNIADECKGFRSAIILVASAMRGKTRVDEWETSLSSLKNSGSSSSADTLRPRIEPQLYPLLRWCYDALPNSDLKNCFLYCAMYQEDETIVVRELVQMWVAEGLVRSKQRNHLMDMAIGQSYVNLLVDRCFFQNAADEKEYIIRFSVEQRIRVDHAVRKMAVYIGEEEENCVFKAGQGLPTIHNADCKRISVRNNDIENLPDNDIENLPDEFPCPKLVTLKISDFSIEEIPPGFLVSLTSLKVLHLHNRHTVSRINSIPSSVGQLKQLEFLSLRGLNHIRNLPEEICHLPSLQFLDLQHCQSLQSLPSKFGELQNLKCLNLSYCSRLEVIPQEVMCQLTSLTTLDAWWESEWSVEAESKAKSIWVLKGLRNLTTLRIAMRVKGRTSSRIEDGIMGTWLGMRHLSLYFKYDDDVVMVDLPQDMKKMSKLQHFHVYDYHGSSLPDYMCNFQHLQAILLQWCQQLRDLHPLERVPNLKALQLYGCDGLKELGIGNFGGFVMLEKLVLEWLDNLESIGGASNNGVWNESRLPRLRILAIRGCPKLRRLPVGMDKFPNLSTIFGESEWWHQINWEDGGMKMQLEKLYKPWEW